MLGGGLGAGKGVVAHDRGRVAGVFRSDADARLRLGASGPREIGKPYIMGPMRPAASRHSYKEIRLQQLRSLCETARLGSLTAAAAALGLAQPTVWEQVHALQREFGVKLIERRAHGCRLTDVG